MREAEREKLLGVLVVAGAEESPPVGGCDFGRGHAAFFVGGSPGGASPGGAGA